MQVLTFHAKRSEIRLVNNREITDQICSLEKLFSLICEESRFKEKKTGKEEVVDRLPQWSKTNMIRA